MRTLANGALVITEEEALEAAHTFELIRQVIGKKSIEDFYGSIEPTYPVDLQAVYNRLHGWRRTAFKQFMLSGWLSIQTFQTEKRKVAYPKQWGYGRYSPTATNLQARIQAYVKGAVDWNDCTEKETEISWKQLCELYREG